MMTDRKAFQKKVNRYIDNQGEGGYVFISHSHKDIKKVRVIRNVLENRGFEPLCFYLKCLTEDDEIVELIEREIDSRSLFVYARSRNSENSKWVQTELDYIDSKGRKIDRIIDLDKYTNNESLANALLGGMCVFIYHSMYDGANAAILKKRLIEKDYRVVCIEADSRLKQVDLDDDLDLRLEKYGCTILLNRSRWDYGKEPIDLYSDGSENWSNILAVNMDFDSEMRSLDYDNRVLTVSKDRMDKDLDEVVSIVEKILVNTFGYNMDLIESKRR